MTMLASLTSQLSWRPLRCGGMLAHGLTIQTAPVNAAQAKAILDSAGLSDRLPKPGFERVLSKTYYLVNLNGELEIRRVEKIL